MTRVWFCDTEPTGFFSSVSILRRMNCYQMPCICAWWWVTWWWSASSSHFFILVLFFQWVKVSYISKLNRSTAWSQNALKLVSQFPVLCQVIIMVPWGLEEKTGGIFSILFAWGLQSIKCNFDEILSFLSNLGVKSWRAGFLFSFFLEKTKQNKKQLCGILSHCRQSDMAISVPDLHNKMEYCNKMGCNLFAWVEGLALS